MKHTITIINDDIYFDLKKRKIELERKFKKVLTWDEFLKIFLK